MGALASLEFSQLKENEDKTKKWFLSLIQSTLIGRGDDLWESNSESVRPLHGRYIHTGIIEVLGTLRQNMWTLDQKHQLWSD